MSLFFLFQKINVTFHPWQLAVVGDAQCFSNLCNEPAKADERQRGEIRLQTTELNIHIYPLPLIFLLLHVLHTVATYAVAPMSQPFPAS